MSQLSSCGSITRSMLKKRKSAPTQLETRQKHKHNFKQNQKRRPTGHIKEEEEDEDECNSYPENKERDNDSDNTDDDQIQYNESMLKKQVHEWISFTPLPYEQEQWEREWGNSFHSSNVHLRLQKAKFNISELVIDYSSVLSNMPLVYGIIIQQIRVPPAGRNHGIATRVIQSIVEKCRELHKKFPKQYGFVMIQSILSPAMQHVAQKLGFVVRKYSPNDYILLC